MYQIKQARSAKDGLGLDSVIRMPPVPIEGDETNIASPCVWRESEGYHMLYCVSRGHGGYCLERAFSIDGVEWEKLGAPVRATAFGESGWDSNCMAYPSTFVFTGYRDTVYIQEIRMEKRVLGSQS